MIQKFIAVLSPNLLVKTQFVTQLMDLISLLFLFFRDIASEHAIYFYGNRVHLSILCVGFNHKIYL